MTQNARYCAGCGRASCGTCGRKVRQPPAGGSAGGWFWGILLAIGVLFWPNIFVHGPHRLPCEIGWYSFLGAVVLLVLIGASASPKPTTGVPVTRPPYQPTPDLRESGEFAGKW